MNTQSNAVPESPLQSQAIAPAVMAATHPMYWSLRRELWENRWVYVAPLAAAAVSLFGFIISTVHFAAKMRAALALDPEKQREAVVAPYEMTAGLIMAAAFIVGIFYCLEALHSERRDRSILFWKSLPVSDLTTVLSKVGIAFAIPVFGFFVTIVTQLIVLLLSSVVLAASGVSVAALWAQLPLYQMSVMLLYHLVTVHVLWYAPIYAWLLLVSAWARRAAFLWAFLPPLAICFAEKITFNTWYFASMLQNRISGPEAFRFTPPGSASMGHMTHLEPGLFFSAPGLWIGLALAAVFIAAVVRLRRYRAPI